MSLRTAMECNCQSLLYAWQEHVNENNRLLLLWTIRSEVHLSHTTRLLYVGWSTHGTVKLVLKRKQAIMWLTFVFQEVLTTDMLAEYCTGTY